ncbi:MAG: thymidine phosphorylase [Opitutaceae bacterium]|nr:thymidine phosphorylase [Opitutaceae bacterium]
MFPQHIIARKRDGHALTREEIAAFVRGATDGSWADYQLSALLMAIFIKGMTPEETAHYTDAMMRSGVVADLSAVPGIKVDKHSTGGVGDKVSIPLAPMVVACGVPVPMISGRGLGHSGGTLDKLESIPGCTISLSPDRFIRQVNEIGIAVAGQTAELVPADKLMYALRDVTGSVPSIPLIASSIMSKKLASGADVICLDVKIGDGAFMKTIEDATRLSRLMVEIGKSFGKSVTAFITDMNQPLGLAVGNRLEVAEAFETLSGRGPADLETLCVEIGAEMVHRAGKAPSVEAAKKLLHDNLHNGKALAKFQQFIRAQGGKLDNLDGFITAKFIETVKAPKAGYVKTIRALPIGLATMQLGGGRATKDDVIDPNVGIVLAQKIGAPVVKGDVLATLYASAPVTAAIRRAVQEAFEIVKDAVGIPPIILGTVR